MTQADAASQADTPPPVPSAQGVTADEAADATGREELFNQGEGAAAGSQVGRDEDFALGRDGPFGPDHGKAFED